MTDKNSDAIGNMDIHEINNKAISKKFILYKYSLLLRKIYRGKEGGGGAKLEWVLLNFQLHFWIHKVYFFVAETNKLWVCNNILVYRLLILNNN